MDNWMVGSRGNNTREGKFMLVPKVYVGTKEPTKKKRKKLCTFCSNQHTSQPVKEKVHLYSNCVTDAMWPPCMR